MVVAEGEGGVRLRVEDITRPFILQAAGTVIEVIDLALAESPSAKEDGDRRARLAATKRLQHELQRTTGPTYLLGPERVMVDVIREATRTATDCLDMHVASRAGDPRPLDRDSAERLRVKARAASALIEAWIACEEERFRSL
ncbi:MAG TPA: hypothetical protein VEX36_05770 [Thermoleophilaceae bacterium]|nr:hypothetical protein [Thermoleophilaceae bacterium]